MYQKCRRLTYLFPWCSGTKIRIALHLNNTEHSHEFSGHLAKAPISTNTSNVCVFRLHKVQTQADQQHQHPFFWPYQRCASTSQLKLEKMCWTQSFLCFAGQCHYALLLEPIPSIQKTMTRIMISIAWRSPRGLRNLSRRLPRSAACEGFDSKPAVFQIIGASSRLLEGWNIVSVIFWVCVGITGCPATNECAQHRTWSFLRPHLRYFNK